MDMPVAHSGKPATKDWIFTHGIASLQVPFDLGTFRKLKERCDGARKTTYCVDAVFNPLIIQLFMDDQFCDSQVNRGEQPFREWMVKMVLTRIEESIGVKLVASKVKLNKEFRYKDSAESDLTPRDFEELVCDKESLDDLRGGGGAPSEPTLNTSPSPRNDDVPSAGPLIQEVTSTGRKKPALKKGFLTGKAAKEAPSLYGPEGSKEGVLPENAGDPMGYLPKKLRQSCKIVDCNSPEYKEKEAKAKAINQTNEMNKEFNDELLKGFDHWGKTSKQEIWEADMPDGTDAPQKSKYDVDYKRFDDIVEEPEQPVHEDRDWYYDESGVRRKIVKQAPAATTTGAATRASADGAPATRAPAVKKGFLDNAKKPLYPPQGSEQAAPRDEARMLKELGNLMGPEAGKPQSFGHSATTAPVVNKVRELVAPEFKLQQEESDGLKLLVSVPGLMSMQEVNLDVTERNVSMSFPSGCGLRPLHVELPVGVVPNSVRAKFSKKRHEITVSMPRSDSA
jgi:hypothetical protein